jgi:DNA-binding transcriptional MerR regulator
MQIGEVATQSGLSIDTLRYYERIGLIDPRPRLPSGHRDYDEDALGRAEALSYLRASGMSIEDMRTYVRNLRRGDVAAAEHATLLGAHAVRLADELHILQRRHDYISAKAAFWHAVATQGRESADAQRFIQQAIELSKGLK